MIFTKMMSSYQPLNHGVRNHVTQPGTQLTATEPSDRIPEQNSTAMMIMIEPMMLQDVRQGICRFTKLHIHNTQYLKPRIMAITLIH